MSQKVTGNIRGLRPLEMKRLNKLFNRRCEKNELISFDLARELFQIATDLNRKVGLLISREGTVEEVFVGEKTILYLPDIGRYRLGKGRLRRLRFVFSDLTKAKTATIPADILGDLEKLRFDAVVGVKELNNKIQCAYAYLTPEGRSEQQIISDLSLKNENFSELIDRVEFAFEGSKTHIEIPNSAILIHVSKKSSNVVESSLDELSELARTAGLKILERIVQGREPDPRSVLGKGKLEEVILRSLRLGAAMLIFDCELRPAQWRAITNATNIKVIDRSMLILDIFAGRAKTSEGALQVELAQLQYNLPRLVEKDAGLSRLIGGIGGRGPGETKLEIGRRRIRDRITELEKRIKTLRQQRAMRRERRTESGIPLVALIGYTNVGKSTLFNRLTGSSVIVENKLFATLDPYQRRLDIPDDQGNIHSLIVADTVGFVRDLPHELTSAFRATLEELSSASFVLHIVDASDLLVDQRIEAVQKILKEMDLGSLKTQFVINKADKASRSILRELKEDLDGVVVSALNGEGLKDLRHFLIESTSEIMSKESLETALE
jgi:GTP-binding protein HflX